MDLVTLLVVQAIAFLLLLVWLKRRVDRELSADRALEEIRKEIGDLITDLNGTTERNITLIEDRVQRLNKVLETTDRKIGILQKEAEKHEVGTGMYTDLLNQHRRKIRESSDAVPVENKPPPFVDPMQSGKTIAHESSAFRASDANSNKNEKPSQESDRYGNAPPSVSTGREVAHGLRERPGSRGEGLRNQVRDLHRAGLGAETIAKRLGSTVGEVELIIGLEAGNNEVSSD